MALAPFIHAPQAGTLTVARQAATMLDTFQGSALAVFNVPADAVKTTAADAIVAYRRTAQSVRATQGHVLAVTRGRTINPRVRAWTFTLDGHDFYALRLGDGVTLLYDVYAEKWVEWTTSNAAYWNANTGINWSGAQGLANTYGSSVVVGDDTFGLLWFLDPKQGFDDHPDAANSTQQIPFQRIVTGQALASGRQNIPCYTLFLDGDNYGTTATEFEPTVVLEYSDDQGRNFVAAETLPVQESYTWYSLGQISAPGRIFRIRDTGIFTRIDSLEMNDDAG